MLKTLVSILAFTFSFLAPHDAIAAASAKLDSINVKRSPAGLSVDLQFDRPVAARTLKPGFERDFVQIPLRGVRMDGARMLAAQDSEIQKIFIYPYSSDTVRMRLILKRESQWARGRITVWNNNPKSVRVFVKEMLPTKAASESKRAPIVAAALARLEPAPAANTPPAPPASNAPAAPAAPAASKGSEMTAALTAADPSERKLLNEVVSNTRDIDINNPDSVKAALAPKPAPSASPPPVSAVEKTGEKTGTETGPVGIASDPTRHFTRMAAALLGVLALFIGIALLTKRYASKIGKLPFGKKERLIQVVATHYLGNKKSISLVKITGEYMVVGVSNDGISLISKLGPETNVDKYLEDRFWGGTFEKHLDHYSKDAISGKQIELSSYDGVKDLAAGVRDDVKIEAPAPAPSAVRASIKEKLTKLKPLA